MGNSYKYATPEAGSFDNLDTNYVYLSWGLWLAKFTVAKNLEKKKYVEFSPDAWHGLDIALFLELEVFDFCFQVVMKPSVVPFCSLCLQKESESIFVTKTVNEQLIL